MSFVKTRLAREEGGLYEVSEATPFTLVQNASPSKSSLLRVTWNFDSLWQFSTTQSAWRKVASSDILQILALFYRNMSHPHLRIFPVDASCKFRLCSM